MVEKKTTAICIRLTDAERRLFERMARADGRSLSAWIRRMVKLTVERAMEEKKTAPGAR